MFKIKGQSYSYSAFPEGQSTWLDMDKVSLKKKSLNLTPKSFQWPKKQTGHWDVKLQVPVKAEVPKAIPHTRKFPITDAQINSKSQEWLGFSSFFIWWHFGSALLETLQVCCTHLSPPHFVRIFFFFPPKRHNILSNDYL